MLTPDSLGAIGARAEAWPAPCGVCMGHSPSWDGHDKGCAVPIIREDVPALIAEIALLKTDLDKAAEQMQEAWDERDAARARWPGLIEELDARADRAEETLLFVRVERDNALADVARLRDKSRVRVEHQRGNTFGVYIDGAYTGTIDREA